MRDQNAYATPTWLEQCMGLSAVFWYHLPRYSFRPSLQMPLTVKFEAFTSEPFVAFSAVQAPLALTAPLRCILNLMSS